MANITLSSTTQQVSTQQGQIQYPDILTQFTPPIIEANNDNGNIVKFATVGVNQVIVRPGEPAPQPRRKTFDPVVLRKNTGPLVIHGKRWYFRLVTGKNGDYKRARALMDDFSLNQISHHMVVCFTPDTVPGNNRPFRNKNGEPIRIYAFFDSYLEFFEYMQKFPPVERAFYEIIFGELPQKPHFDIDISLSDLYAKYPDENIDTVAETLREAVMRGCIEVLAENLVTLDLSRDMLLYRSHGGEKRSYHVVINNKCHDGNKEARAFYDAVMAKVRIYTNGKYLDFVDKSVYSPRQQFRMVECQKWGSNRPKVFDEEFDYQGDRYTHTYTEAVTDFTMKKLTIIYESMVSFTSGCVFLPSLVPPKPANQNNLGELPDLDHGIVDHCMSMLREKMPFCPFTVKDVQGHIIMLKRNSPSQCPICRKEHEHENPYMLIVGGKVYWDCRRAQDDVKKFFVGYLAMTVDELQSGGALPGIPVQEEDTGGEFMFGDYNLGPPTLVPQKTQIVAKEDTPTPPTTPPKLPPLSGDGRSTIFIPPPEQRRQDVQTSTLKIAEDWANKKYLRREPEDLQGIRNLTSVFEQMSWNPGMK